MTQNLTLADARTEAERVVRRLTSRVKGKLLIVEQHAATIRKVLESGDLAQFNDLGELQGAGSALDSAIAALYTANEALELLKMVQEAGS